MPSEDLSAQQLEQLLSDIKRDLLVQIILHLRHHEISLKESQRLAQQFLAMFPINNKEELFKKLAELAEEYPEARAVYIKYATSFDEEKKQSVLQRMQDHMQRGDFQQAIKVAQEVTEGGVGNGRN